MEFESHPAVTLGYIAKCTETFLNMNSFRSYHLFGRWKSLECEL